MNQWFVLFVVCYAASGIETQQDWHENHFQPVHIPKPNGEMIYFTGGLPLMFFGQKPVMPITLPMLLRIPGPPAGSILPLALWPYFNQFNPSFISNGFYKQRASTPASISTSTGFDSGNETRTSYPANAEKTTVSPTATTEDYVASSSADWLALAVDVNQPVTRPSIITPTHSTPLSSLAMPTGPVITVQRDGDYSFEYSVNNQNTGDVKSHAEKRVDGVVTGYYSLVEADKTLRKVNYTADANGFRATVSKLPLTDKKMGY